MNTGSFCFSIGELIWRCSVCGEMPGIVQIRFAARLPSIENPKERSDFTPISSGSLSTIAELCSSRLTFIFS